MLIRCAGGLVSELAHREGSEQGALISAAEAQCRHKFQEAGTKGRHANKKARQWRANLLMGLGRVELPTSRLSGVRSNHLSYRPQNLST